MPRKNKNLDRPRIERPYDKSTCVSTGVEGGWAEATRMMFQQKRPEDLWGRKR
jgi:hypothetical protein